MPCLWLRPNSHFKWGAALVDAIENDWLGSPIDADVPETRACGEGREVVRHSWPHPKEQV